MKIVFIFDFDGTFYSGEHKFDNVKGNLEENKRNFLSTLSDEEYEMICRENPRWINAATGNDVVRCIGKLSKKYSNLNINLDSFYNWQTNFIYDVILDYTQIVDTEFMENLCNNYPVYVVSNSSLKHIYYYMEKIGINRNWFKKVIGNELKKEDPTKKHYYQEIINEEGVAPHNTYVFGDSVESDLTPAIHLGINAFYVDNAVNISKLVTKVLEKEI